MMVIFSSRNMSQSSDS